MERKYLIGIDPSLTTAGVAIYSPADGKLILHSGDVFSCMGFLNKSGILSQSIAVVENPNLDNTVFNAWRLIAVEIEKYKNKTAPIGDVKMKFGISMKHAQGVGKNKAAADLFIEMLGRAGIPVLEIAPSSRHRADKDLMKSKVQGVKMLSMPTKTTAAQFEQYTGYSGRSNEHSRDAATLCSGRSIQWAINQIKIQQAKRQ